MWPFSENNQNRDNKDQQEEEINKQILSQIQNLHPWLGRVCVDDTKFAYILNHITVAIVMKYDELKEQNNSYDFNDMIALIEKGSKVYLGNKNYALGPLCASFFMWLHNICIVNKSLYRQILAQCFDKDTIINSKDLRLLFVKNRLLGLEVENSQINDVYLILKGYLDSMNTICEAAKPKIKNALEDKNAFVSYSNEKYGTTETINRYLNCDEISDVFIRDFLCGLLIKSS